MFPDIARMQGKVPLKMSPVGNGPVRASAAYFFKKKPSAQFRVDNSVISRLARLCVYILPKPSTRGLL